MARRNPESSRGVRFFAFGDDKVSLSQTAKNFIAKFLGMDPDEEQVSCDTKACPAAYAGYQPESGDESTAIAEAYDELVRRKVKLDLVERADDIDLLTEDDARDCWLEAISVLKHYEDFSDAEVGEEIARDLDWLDREETVEPKSPADLGIDGVR